MELNSCTISIGSNTEDREFQINKAIDYLGNHLSECRFSSVYETEACNGRDKPYLNAVAHGFTSVTYEALVKFLKKWESDCGRTAVESCEGIIPIDLDIVIWNGIIKRQRDFDRLYFNKGYRELLANGTYETM